ncbi:hypothetical protein FACS189472_14910 [Alphaproteobacteria bacterium]|nr:hypothetical protein FACS189472_14910 [Alphaproteobacteria bacterium]
MHTGAHRPTPLWWHTLTLALTHIRTHTDRDMDAHAGMGRGAWALVKVRLGLRVWVGSEMLAKTGKVSAHMH